MDGSKIISQIPFGKFYDINGKDKDLVSHLRLVKYEECEPMEPNYIYLFEDTETGKFYCVHEPCAAMPEGAFESFIGNDFKGIKEIKPKSADWYQTHWIYELTK